jgi:hypothetical protein
MKGMISDVAVNGMGISQSDEPVVAFLAFRIRVTSTLPSIGTAEPSGFCTRVRNNPDGLLYLLPIHVAPPEGYSEELRA